MPGPLQVVVLYNKELCSFSEDVVRNLTSSFPSLCRSIDARSAPVKLMDIREPPKVCDICIHIEQPYAVWFPWARINCLVTHEATFQYDAWKGYLDTFDVITYTSNTIVEQEQGKDHKGRAVCVFNGEFLSALKECISALEVREPLPRHMPPLLNIEDCPKISVITLVYNRPKFIENACLNLLSTDYPKDKIEWVVVDDSDPDQSPSNRIVQFQEKFPGKVVYVPLKSKMTIGAKRNIGVEKASADILLMMDDDDHYPSTSFRRRVAYLLKGRRIMDCSVCTTIAMYDLKTGISAVNVPPYKLSLGQRCSEATLTFTRGFWKARQFSESSMAEGEAFLEGREGSVVEMPPQQIIVALTHGNNTSRREVPQGNPGCFWGFPRQLLEFLHGLVGVKVEAA